MLKVEEVARAIYEASAPFSPMFPWPNLQKGFPDADDYRRVARAAIEAMREPTPGMIDAGQGCEAGTLEEDVPRIWQAMIDAALAEGE